MTEPKRSELIGELKGLQAENLDANGQEKEGAVPQELARIKEITALLGAPPPPAQTSSEVPKPVEKMNKAELIDRAQGMGLTVENTMTNAVLKELILHPPPLPDAPEKPTSKPIPPAESADDEVKRLRRENAELKSQKERSRGAAKIKSQEKRIGHVKRPDEIMSEAMAISEESESANWAPNIRLAVERTIRRFVRKGGARKNYKGEFYDLAAGFKKGITLAEKVYALGLLEKMGRLTTPVEEILELLQTRQKMKTGELRATAKEFNTVLEKMGVAWDDEIQVPGMSATATI